MTENQYSIIDNLAKLRIANQILMDCFFYEQPVFERWQKDAIVGIENMVGAMERAVSAFKIKESK